MILSEDACIQKPHKGIFDFALKNTNSRRSEADDRRQLGSGYHRCL